MPIFWKQNTSIEYRYSSLIKKEKKNMHSKKKCFLEAH